MSLLPTQGLLQSSRTEDRIYQHRGPPLGTGASSRHRASSNPLSTEYLPAQRAPSRHRSLLSAAQGPPLGGTGPPLSGTRASSRHRGLHQSPQHRGVGLFGIVSILPTQGPPPILSAQKIFRYRGPPLGTGASSRRHRGLLSAAQGPPLGGTGPPLSGTRASSRHRGLHQSPQHRGVGLFGIVSILPTQGPPPILSAQKIFRYRGPPLGTGASSRRHRGLLSAAQGPPLGGTGPPLSGTRASSRHRDLLQSSQHRGQDLPAQRASSLHRSLLPTQGPPSA